MRKMSSYSIEEISEESFSTLDESIERSDFQKEDYIDIIGNLKNFFEEDSRNKAKKNAAQNLSDFLSDEEEEEENKMNLFDFEDLKENFKSSTKIYKVKSLSNKKIYQKFKVEIFEEPEDILELEEEEEHEISFSDRESLKKNFIEVEDFFPVENSFNFNGNYQKYLGRVMQTIPPLLKTDCSGFIEEKMIDLPRDHSNKKTLILDLDETLIHADFDGNFSFHDQEISFTLNDEEHKVGIILRPGVEEFLKRVNEIFEVGVFTAGIKQYADAVLNYLDPENKIFKFRMYRDSCISINNTIHLKDLRIIRNRKLENLLLVDNSFYSFVNQPENGILINSFYFNKEDSELKNLYNYLRNYIQPAEDVRELNERIFNFRNLMEKAAGIRSF
jgi:Dullard-like phosphatase family protein